MLSRCGSLISGVVGIVKPNGDEIADFADARADARRAAHERQLVDVDLAQLGKPLRRKFVAGDVGDDFRQIADAALGVEHARLFPTGGTEADEFHKILPVIRRRPEKRRHHIAARANQDLTGSAEQTVYQTVS
jgi:hypothetical protein